MKEWGYKILLKAKTVFSKKLREVFGEQYFNLKYYSEQELLKKTNHFNIKRVAILIDEGTDFKKLIIPKGIDVVGYYSFSLKMIGEIVKGRVVLPLISESTVVPADGWFIGATNIFSGYSLNRFLLDSNQSDQIILWQFYFRNGTKYYSYIDFFSGIDISTTVIIHNYLERCYRIPFPLDIRYTLRNSMGDIIRTGQIIIPPNGNKTIVSNLFNLKSFKGYLEIEFDISSKIMPFLHYNAVYFSKDCISSNHQSGLGLQPQNTLFVRGYVPTSPEEKLILCLFQKHYEAPVSVTAILKYTEKSIRKNIKKELPKLKQYHVNYTDIKEYFNEIDFNSVQAPSVSVISDKALHRPNYFYQKRGNEGFYDITHAAGDMEISKMEIPRVIREKFKKLNYHSFIAGTTIFPPELGVDSYLGLWNNNDVFVKTFIFEFYDDNGNLKYSFEDKFDTDSYTYLNVNEYLSKKKITPFSGTFIIRLSDHSEYFLENLFSNVAYSSKKRNYITSTATNIGITNTSFYYSNIPSNYIGRGSVNTSDIYAPGIISDDLDTYFIINVFDGARVSHKKYANYEIVLYNKDGNNRRFEKRISLKGVHFHKLSDLIKDVGWDLVNSNYCLWFFSVEVFLSGLWMVVRKSDGAISIEHCYAGKYGL